jgi:PAP2 superfamily
MDQFGRWRSCSQSLALSSELSQRSQVTGLPGTVILTVAVYLLARGGSALLQLRPTVLDAVPLCLGGAAFLMFFTRNGLPGVGRLIEGIEAILVVAALGLSLACLSYVCAAMDFPLRDREMIWVERQLGFDWLQIMLQLDNWPNVLVVLDRAYATFTFQLIVTSLLLLVVRGTRELDRFLVTFVCASLVAELASVLVPTLGPMASLGGLSKFDHLPTLGRTTAHIVVGLGSMPSTGSSVFRRCMQPSPSSFRLPCAGTDRCSGRCLRLTV